MLTGAKLPNIFWVEVVSTTVYLQNRSHTSVLKNKIYEAVWLGGNSSVGDVARLLIFGNKAHFYIPKEKKKKLDPKTFERILIGYDKNVKGYRLYKLNTKSIINSCNVTFNKDTKIKKKHNH